MSVKQETLELSKARELCRLLKATEAFWLNLQGF